MQRIRSRLTYANVMATIAVFVVLGGIGYAAATINGKDIKKHSEPGNRLKNHTLTAKQVRAPKVHLVGNPGQPIFLSGCRNVGGSDLLVGFFKDDQGVVHLQGAYYDCAPQTVGTVAFQLPQGYRPPPGKELKLPIAGGIAFVGGNGVPAGAVQCNKDPICQLDGVTFRGS